MPSDENKIALSVEASGLVPVALLAPSETARARTTRTMAATPKSLRLMKCISPPLKK